VSDWRHFHYLIDSAPNEDPFDLHNVRASRIEMSPRGAWIIMADADACMIVVGGAQGMVMTTQANGYGFQGNRPNFDNWMARNFPEVAYRWLDEFVISFADQPTRQAFNAELGARVVRHTHLP
jgi:hypothetical protein